MRLIPRQATERLSDTAPRVCRSNSFSKSRSLNSVVDEYIEEFIDSGEAKNWNASVERRSKILLYIFLRAR